MRAESKNTIKNLPNSADFAVITTEVEFEVVKDILGLKSSTRKGGRRYFYGQIASHTSQCNHFVVCAESARSNIPAALCTQDIVNHWRPNYVLVVGIAGGIEGRENVTLGDVVVHEHLEYYEFIKETDGEKRKRILQIEPASPFLLDIMKTITSQEKIKWWEWIKVQRPDQEDRKPKVVRGEILSGDKLLGDSDSELLTKLLETHDKAVAVEMESGGVARALYEARVQHMVHFLVVRAISDYCNKLGSQQVRDKWKKYAAHTAASFALAIIRNTPKLTKARLKHERYRVSLKRKLQTAFPKPSVEFGLTLKFKSEPNRRMLVESLTEEAKNRTRLILRGPAGSGKSIILGKLAKILADSNIMPVFLNLKDWKMEYSKVLSDSSEWVSNPQTFDRVLDVLLRVSITDLNLNMLKNFLPQSTIFILVDGLNEVYGGETVRQILDILDEYVRKQAPNTCVLVTDRLFPHRFLGAQWEVVELGLLDAKEVQRYIDTTFGKGTYNSLPETDKRLLEIPYFLDHILKSHSPHLGSVTKAIKSFFTEQIGFDEPMLNRLSKSAFNMYKDYQSPSFNAEKFKQEIGEEIWARLLGAGVVKKMVNDHAQFDHQLKHDYLASKYLVQDEERWEWTSFDVVSFQSNSFESLSMILEQLYNPSKATAFLKAVYDWNWFATIICMTEAAKVRHRYCTLEMEIAVLAVVAEKLFDPMHWTRMRAKKVLSMFPGGIAYDLRSARTLREILNQVEKVDSKEDWFLKWRILFKLLQGPPLKEEEIRMIMDRDSILGWTASNVIKRFKLNGANLQQLRTIYHAFDENTPRDETVRWRVVHTLGAFDTEENVRLLFHALDKDDYL